MTWRLPFESGHVHQNSMLTSLEDGILFQRNGKFKVFVKIQDGVESLGEFDTLSLAREKWVEGHFLYNHLKRDPTNDCKVIDCMHDEDAAVEAARQKLLEEEKLLKKSKEEKASLRDFLSGRKKKKK